MSMCLGDGPRAQAVFLHENGHVAGLGHSDDSTAVMYAYYNNGLTQLQPDDINGITALYPAAPGTPTNTPTPTPIVTPTATAAVPPESASVSVAYGTSGGKSADKHLSVSVTVSNGAPVSGAAVAMTLLKDGVSYATYQGTTGTNGSVTFTANNAPPGRYSTTGTLTNMTLVGGWPSNFFDKK